MTWTDIRKAKLSEGECYSIRAERTPENFLIFPSMKKGKGKYVINCVRFVERQMQRAPWPRRAINNAGGKLVFEFIDPTERDMRASWGWQLGSNGLFTIVSLYAIDIEIKPTKCMTPRTKAATIIQKEQRGNTSRLTSKVEGRMTRKEKIKEWPKMKRTLQAQGWTPGDILDFAENSYLLERGDTPERSRRSIAEKHGMKKKKKSKKKSKKTKKKKDKKN